jgi:spore photoproduct lyase
MQAGRRFWMNCSGRAKISLMSMIDFKPEKILVEEQSWNDACTHEMIARLPGVPVETIADAGSAIPELNRSSDPRTSGKRMLVLTRQRGSFMKECPGSGAEICCNYFVVNFASNCHLECTYCVLQSYLDNPAILVFTNQTQMLDEIRAKLRAAPERFFRIGTGEMADSLALDDITLSSRLLVPFFAEVPNGILELKTKSDRIANLRGLEHRGRTVVSWSVNSERICRSEELKTSSLEERLAAARRCQEWGYRIGFHFDPIVYYPGWEAGYEQAVKDVFRSVDHARIAWVSLGALRFTPHLRQLIRQRFPKSVIPYGEFVPGHHGKLRYFRPIREELYTRMRAWIRREAPGVFVYLCMENRAAWDVSGGGTPEDSSRLSCRMDSLVQIND